LGKVKTISVLLFAVLMGMRSSQAFAQKKKVKPELSENWVFRLGIGKTQFYGDASHDDKWEKLMTESRLDYTTNVRKQFNKVLGVGTEFFFSKVRSRKGEDNMPTPLKYELASYYFETNAFVFVDLSALVFRDGFLHRFSVYTTAGVGYAFWKSELTDVATGEVMHSGNTYNGQYYKKGGVVLPVTFGLKFNVTYEWLIYVDTQMRTILNDQLDVWVGGHPFDFLFAASIGVSYRLNYIQWPLSGKSRRSKSNERFLQRIYYNHHPH